MVDSGGMSMALVYICLVWKAKAKREVAFPLFSSLEPTTEHHQPQKSQIPVSVRPTNPPEECLAPSACPAQEAAPASWRIESNQTGVVVGDNEEAPRAHISKMADVAKDLVAGTVGGVANLIVGHPFDTIKVKLQSQPTPPPSQLPKYAGAMDAVKQTLAAEGPRGLYKGMGAPLATVAAFNAVLFTVRGQMEALLRSEPGAPLTVRQQVVAGAGAGVAVSFLACPTELIKCRLQAQSALVESAAASKAVQYGGPIDVAKHVVREAGLKGLFKGLIPTMGREVPGNAVMFGVYEATKQYIAGEQDTSMLGRGPLILAGGLAGACFWLSVYPTDVVKSVIQVDDYKNPKYSGSIDAFSKILAADGVKGLYKGFGPAMARSVPANAACFVAYEIARSSLG